MEHRAHLWLRLVAIALIALAAAWPRAPRVGIGSRDVAASNRQGPSERIAASPSPIARTPARTVRTSLARADAVALGRTAPSSTDEAQDADRAVEELPLTN